MKDSEINEDPIIKIVATHVHSYGRGKLTVECEGEDFLEVSHEAYGLLYQHGRPDRFLLLSCRAVMLDIVNYGVLDEVNETATAVRTLQASIQAVETMGFADSFLFEEIIQKAKAWIEESTN